MTIRLQSTDFADWMHEHRGSEEMESASTEETPWLRSAKLWCDRILEGEERCPYSSRDGKYLKRIPSSRKLNSERSCSLLSSEFLKHVHLHDLAKNGVRLHKASSKYRALLYLLRARIYDADKKHEWALKDIKSCLAYSEKSDTVSCLACLTLSYILEVQGDNIGAAIALAKSLEWAKSPPEEEDHQKNRLQCILQRLPPSAHEAYDLEGFLGLENWKTLQKELEKPPILQKHPKFYWYYQWMRRRIQYKCGALPEPVIQKLLKLDATDLDTLLMATRAIQAQARELLWILKEKGQEELEKYDSPELTWEEVKFIKEIRDEQSEPEDLFKEIEDTELISTSPILLEASEEFIPRTQQLLLDKRRSLSIKNE